MDGMEKIREAILDKVGEDARLRVSA